MGWLHAGYPDGVPQQENIALLGILHRQLSEEEIIQIARTLSGDAAEDLEARIRLAIKRRTLQPATDDEVARVSAKLAMAGWPLAAVEPDRPAEPEATDTGEPTVEPETSASAEETETEPVTMTATESRSAEGRASDPEARRNVMKRLIAWVRQGYPTGVPAAAIMGTTNEVPSIEEIERVHHHLSETTGTNFSED